MAQSFRFYRLWQIQNDVMGGNFPRRKDCFFINFLTQNVTETVRSVAL